MNAVPAPTSILITGASGGIGAALALAYARPGVRLALTGRDQTRLAGVAGACREAGAESRTEVLDVCKRARLAAWIAEVDRAAPLDLVIANAGISAGTGDGGETEAQARRIVATNFDGVLNTVLPAIACMGPRGRGQVAIMSSLAAFRCGPKQGRSHRRSHGFPSGP